MELLIKLLQVVLGRAFTLERSFLKLLIRIDSSEGLAPLMILSKRLRLSLHMSPMRLDVRFHVSQIKSFRFQILLTFIINFFKKERKGV